MSGAKSVSLIHGLDIVANSRINLWFFVPLIRRDDLAICNSQNTAKLASEYEILMNPYKITVSMQFPTEVHFEVI